MTEFGFHIMNADTKNGLNHALVRVVSVRNANENSNADHTITSSGAIAFEKLTDGKGNISAKCASPAAGIYQIIVRTTTIDGRASLSSFSLSVLRYW